MTHKTYAEELERRTKRIKWYYLALFSIVSVAVIGLLMVIRSETSFFVAVQERKINLTDEEKLEIENKLLANWARRDLGLQDRFDIEKRVLGAEVEAKSLSAEDRQKIESRLNQ